MYICRNKQRRQRLKWQRTRTVHKCAAPAKFAFHLISLCANGIEPELQTMPRLSEIFRIGFDKCVVVVRNPPISGVKDDTGPVAQGIRQLERLKPCREYDRRRVAFKFDPFLRYTALC